MKTFLWLFIISSTVSFGVVLQYKVHRCFISGHLQSNKWWF